MKKRLDGVKDIAFGTQNKTDPSKSRLEEHGAVPDSMPEVWAETKVRGGNEGVKKIITGSLFLQKTLGEEEPSAPFFVDGS